MKAWMIKGWLSLRYRWCMANAYLTQHYHPVFSAQWLHEADRCWMDLWRINRESR